MDWRVNINGKEIGMSHEEYKQMLEDNLSDKFKSRFNEPVYSATYDDNGGWPERDRLPEGDVYDDIDDSSFPGPPAKGCEVSMTPVIACKDFYENMKKRCINPDGKYAGPSLKYPKFDPGVSIKLKTCCENPQKYKNVISNNLKFYSCKNCGADLGDC